MRVLFLENDDSFSWNIVDRLPFERDRMRIRSGRQAAGDFAALDGFDRSAAAVPSVVTPRSLSQGSSGWHASEG